MTEQENLLSNLPMLDNNEMEEFQEGAAAILDYEETDEVTESKAMLLDNELNEEIDESTENNKLLDDNTGEDSTERSALFEYMDDSIEGPRNVKDPKYSSTEHRRIMRNVIVISISFAILFTAFSSMAHLQSSINNGPEKAGLGNWSSSVIHAAALISALFVPSYAISHLKAKWTIFVFMFGYSTYIIAQFNPQFYTLMPAAAIVGFSAAPMWTAKSTYLSHVGREYAALTGEKNPEVTIMWFLGIFHTIFEVHHIFGNIISSTVLSRGVNETTKVMNDPKTCGANFCPGTKLPSFEGLENTTKIWTLAGIYLVIAFIAPAFLGLFTDSLTRYGENEKKGMSSRLAGTSKLIATFKQMANPNQILMIPLTIWSGMGIGFIGADFTAAYITCGWGVENIGYVLIFYGTANAIFSILFANFVAWLGRVYVFSLAAVFNAVLILILLVWEPSREDKYLFFVFALYWGALDSWHGGITAYYGVLFPCDEEAGFSNGGVWTSLGFLISFSESNLMCVHTKLYILLGVLIVGMLGFYTIEFREWSRTNRKTKSCSY